jgi:hypothetical protein
MDASPFGKSWQERLIKARDFPPFDSRECVKPIFCVSASSPKMISTTHVHTLADGISAASRLFSFTCV